MPKECKQLPDLDFQIEGPSHIAGVVNPASVQKYGFWTHPELPPDPQAWLAAASHHPGSWWPHWQEWNARHSGALVPARQPGDGQLPALEDAPGSYARVRAV